MAYFGLLWKARTIEKYRSNYEKEKFNSVMMSNTQIPEKTLFQKWRHYSYGVKKKVSKIFKKRWPEGSPVSNFFVYLRTDQTFANFALKSVIGFVGGIVLTYFWFMFFVFQLSISLIHATIMSSIIGVPLTLGLAFSYRMRCLVFLLIPQFFSRVGRYTITCYALVLILTGPATNTLRNSEVLSESMVCSQEQIKTNVQQITESIKKPFQSIKNDIKLMMERVGRIAMKMKETVVKLQRLALSIVRVLQSAFSWLHSTLGVCNSEFGKPYDRCLRALHRGSENCKAKLGHNKSFCNVGYIAKITCWPVKSVNHFCALTDCVRGNIAASVRKKLRKFSDRIGAMLYVEIHMHHSYSFSSNASKSASQMAAGIVTDIRNRADPLLTWLSWSSCVTSLFLALIIFRAKYYQHMFETRSRFDNRYITKELRELDLKRLRQGRETVLPLNRRERAKYITTTSFRLLTSEKTYLTRSVVFMIITTFKLMTHMIADYSLYWVLMTIRHHGRFQSQLQPGTPDAEVHIVGSGFLASLFRSLISSFSVPLMSPTPSPVPCLPNPHPPDLRRYMQIVVLILLLWFFALFEPYGLRLRHVIMGLYQPERARARSTWLYNHILRTRGSFMKFARRKLHREYKYSSEARLTFRQWLNNHIPCSWLRSLLETAPREPRCILCGTTEYPDDLNTHIIRCESRGCPGTYCECCFSDIGQLCTICMGPADYGDMSDVSLEIGSSEESSDDDDTDREPLLKQTPKVNSEFSKYFSKKEIYDDDRSKDKSSTCEPTYRESKCKKKALDGTHLYGDDDEEIYKSEGVEINDYKYMSMNTALVLKKKSYNANMHKNIKNISELIEVRAALVNESSCLLEPKLKSQTNLNIKRKLRENIDIPKEILDIEAHISHENHTNGSSKENIVQFENKTITKNLTQNTFKYEHLETIKSLKVIHQSENHKQHSYNRKRNSSNKTHIKNAKTKISIKSLRNNILRHFNNFTEVRGTIRNINHGIKTSGFECFQVKRKRKNRKVWKQKQNKGMTFLHGSSFVVKCLVISSVYEINRTAKEISVTRIVKPSSVTKILRKNQKKIVRRRKSSSKRNILMNHNKGYSLRKFIYDCVQLNDISNDTKGKDYIKHEKGERRNSCKNSSIHDCKNEQTHRTQDKAKADHIDDEVDDTQDGVNEKNSESSNCARRFRLKFNDYWKNFRVNLNPYARWRDIVRKPNMAFPSEWSNYKSRKKKSCVDLKEIDLDNVKNLNEHSRNYRISSYIAERDWIQKEYDEKINVLPECEDKTIQQKLSPAVMHFTNIIESQSAPVSDFLKVVDATGQSKDFKWNIRLKARKCPCKDEKCIYKGDGDVKRPARVLTKNKSDIKRHFCEVLRCKQKTIPVTLQTSDLAEKMISASNSMQECSRKERDNSPIPSTSKSKPTSMSLCHLDETRKCKATMKDFRGNFQKSIFSNGNNYLQCAKTGTLISTSSDELLIPDVRSNSLFQESTSSSYLPARDSIANTNKCQKIGLGNKNEKCEQKKKISIKWNPVSRIRSVCSSVLNKRKLKGLDETMQTDKNKISQKYKDEAIQNMEMKEFVDKTDKDVSASFDPICLCQNTGGRIRRDSSIGIEIETPEDSNVFAHRCLCDEGTNAVCKTCTCATQYQSSSKEIGTIHPNALLKVQNMAVQCRPKNTINFTQKPKKAKNRLSRSQESLIEDKIRVEDLDLPHSSSSTDTFISTVSSRSGTKTDTTVCSHVTLGYIDEAPKRKRERRLKVTVITKTNRATMTNRANVCDVSTLTSDWWSPIVERKEKKISLEKKEKKDNRVMPNQKRQRPRQRRKNSAVATEGKIVKFKSKALVIPVDTTEDILSPSRYLLESQKYYNELFSTRLYSPHVLQTTALNPSCKQVQRNNTSNEFGRPM